MARIDSPDRVIEWVKSNQTLATWLGVASIVTFLGALIAVPVLVTRIGADYFMPEAEAADGDRLKDRHPVLRWSGLILKNLLGGLLVLTGLVLSIPLVVGQGFLTIFIGLMIMDFPGKRKLELRLIRLRPLRRAIDWIRHRYGREPLRLPEP